jgi:putative Holliday junction resolvase
MLAEELIRCFLHLSLVVRVVVPVHQRLDVVEGNPQATLAVRLRAAFRPHGASLPVALQDERLTSREAESLLAERDKDWRSRKKRLDAVAAAIILQDHLDGLAR